MKNESPCQGCRDRVVGCHSKCPKYIEYDRINKERLLLKSKQDAGRKFSKKRK